MTSWETRAALILVALAFCPLTGRGQTTPPEHPPASVTYEQFMKLDAAQRSDVWGTLIPETKAALMRMHAERWLEHNRGRLTDRQAQLVEEAIAFVTPALYRNPHDPELLKQEAALRAKLLCGLRQSDAINAFKVLSPEAVSSDWRADLWTWLEHCLFG